VREHLLEHAAAQLVLGREVIEERRLSDADRLRDVAQRRPHEAARREQPCGVLEDLLGDVDAGGAFGHESSSR
jgi:hypothetical protein